MAKQFKNIEEYVHQVPEERQEAFQKLLKVIRDHLPEGFQEEINYNMPGWVVPHSIFPDGYHCDPKLPLPFLNLANQKGFIAVYSMGIYSDSKILNWFTEEYPKHAKRKLDMGKSCIRFKKMDDIPYELIGELIGKMSLETWVDKYQRSRAKAKK